ncbi:hypothetical protein SAMN02910436_02700 [Ruminococcaceae bacterium P7]|nr:hypothetical protein SAMN02910436_02700 [Ruminococcaceae bacterium P7]
MKATNFIQKQKKKIITAVAALNVAALSVISAGAVPDGVDTGSYSSLVDIVFWVATIAIAAGGGIPSLIKLVQGQADEDPRGRNAGIAGLVITGAVVGAAAAVKTLLF